MLTLRGTATDGPNEGRQIAFFPATEHRRELVVFYTREIGVGLTIYDEDGYPFNLSRALKRELHVLVVQQSINREKQ